MKPFLPPFSRNAACLLLVLSALAGCGGHTHHHDPVGQIKFDVIWPSTSNVRVIPINAQSIVVLVKQGATVVNSSIIARPGSTVTFNEVPTGSMSVVATAYASTDGTGTPLATATVPTTVTSNNTSNVVVTLASTIDHLEVTPNPYPLAALASGTINVVAKDASGNVVLLDPSVLSFSSSNASIVSVTSGGVATAGGSVGSATITITESNSGKTLALPVSIVAAVSVSPTTSSLTLRGTATFVATVVGPANTSVTWSVLEGASGGTITPGGVYTAPTTHGTYHVVATSVADATRSATATVTVASGGIGVTVN